MEENSVLRAQLAQSTTTLDALKGQLTQKESEVVQAKEQNKADLQYF